MPDNAGEALTSSQTDMDQQNKAQRSNAESEQKYHTLFEQASDPIMVTDFNGDFADVNTAMCNLFGYSKEELLKMNIRHLINEEQLKKTPIRFDLLALGQQVFNNREMVHRDGSTVYVEANVKKVDEGLVMAIARDVTKLKKAEEKIIAHERQLQLFVEHSPAAIAMFDRDMRYINVSGRWMKEYNLTGSDVIGRSHYDVFPGIPQRWKEIHQKCLAGATEKNDEDSFPREDGTTEWLRWEIHPWYNVAGDIGGIMMLTEVITEKKNTEFALKEAETKFRNLVEKSMVGVYIMQKGRYTYVNPVFAEIFGYDPGELIDSYPVEIVVHEEDRSIVLENVRARMSGETDSVHYEIRGVKKDGTMIWIEVFGSRTIYKGDTAIIGTLIDITQKKIMEKEILDQKVQEQKKITRAIIRAQERERNHIGRELHDNVNQILAGTKLYLGMAASTNPRLKETLGYPIELIDNSINEIRNLTGKQVTPLRDINLEELIQQLLEKLNESTVIKSALLYKLEDARIDDDLKLNIYRIVQEQVSNIIKHADAKNVNISLNATAGNIELIVADDGKGFNVNKKRKGIGISNITNRVESFNGKMAIKSSPGKGTEITIHVPS